MTPQETRAVNTVRLDAWSRLLYDANQLAIILVSRPNGGTSGELVATMADGIPAQIAAKLLRDLADSLDANAEHPLLNRRG